MRGAEGSKIQGEGASTRCGLDRQSDVTCFDPDCQDAIDWSTCGYLSNVGQCGLMNTLADFGVWVPCEATCGSCELNIAFLHWLSE